MAISTDQLLGTWRVLRSDDPAFAGSLMTFKPGGELLYLAPAPDGSNRYFGVQMTYRLEGDVLVTDQPSDPGENRQRCRLEGPDTLWLDLDGAGVWYTRDRSLA